MPFALCQFFVIATIAQIMADPISITLAVLAMLDPAIRSCRQAYGTYKLTKNFGRDYHAVQLRLNGQQACLEMALNTELMNLPDENILNTITEQLGNISNHFQSCKDMFARIECHLGTSFCDRLRETESL